MSRCLRSSPRAALLLVAALLSACVLELEPTWPPLTCPDRGGPNWSELASPHFLLRTDLPERDARALFDELEEAYDALEQIFHLDLPSVALPSEPVRVTAFAHARDVQALNPQVGGFFTRGHAWEPLPSIVMSNARDWHGHTMLRHELTHRFVAHFLPSAPPWLNEGLADVYSTARVRKGRVEVGGWDPDLYRNGYQPDVRELFRADYAKFSEQPGYYNEAHALAHLLQSERRGHRMQFEELLRRLSTGQRWQDAWREVFPRTDLDDLENEVNRYRVITLRTDTRWFGARAVTRPIPSARRMNDAEVHLLWVELRSWRGANDRAQVERDLAQARREAPDAPALHYWAACFLRATGGSLRAATDEMRRALAGAPDEPRYLFPMLQLEPTLALADRLAARAQSSAQWLQVAWAMRLWQRTDDALAAARRSVELEPGCRDCWDILGQLALAAERTDEAAAAIQRAAQLGGIR